MIEATKTCLGKYFTFSGRADSYEFWGFALAILVASILVAFLNAAIFGPEVTTTFQTTMSTNGEVKQGFHTKKMYGPGPLTTVLNLALAVPLLAAGWRRMHDSGRPGWLLLVPAAVLGSLQAFRFFVRKRVVPIPQDARDAAPHLPEFIEIPEPSIGLAAGTFAMACAMFGLWLFWLTRRSEGPNRYGPPQAGEPA